MQSSPLLAFNAKAEKSRSLVTAYATLLRRFGYQLWLLPFDQYQCISRILCREQPLQFFCNSKTANFFKEGYKTAARFFLKSKTAENTEASKLSLQCLSRFSQALYTRFVLAKLKRELFSIYEIS